MLQVIVDSVAGGDDSDGLLNISDTEESSVLTEGEMSFTLYEITNMADTRIMYCYFNPAQLDIMALCLACQTLEPIRVDSRVGNFNKLFLFFFLFLFL